MDIVYPSFGTIVVNGERFEYDVVIEAGRVRKRNKGPSKPLRRTYGHTPLTIAEDIPWGSDTLIIGTGADGRLPIDPGITNAAQARSVHLVAVTTAEACELLADVPDPAVFAILHVTC